MCNLSADIEKQGIEHGSQFILQYYNKVICFLFKNIFSFVLEINIFFFERY